MTNITVLFTQSGGDLTTNGIDTIYFHCINNNQNLYIYNTIFRIEFFEFI